MLDGRGSIKRRLGARLWLAGTWLGLMALLALFAPLISPHDPLAQDLFAGRLPPFWLSGSDRPYLHHHRHRRHRLDPLLPGGTGGSHEPVGDGLCLQRDCCRPSAA